MHRYLATRPARGHHRSPLAAALALAALLAASPLPAQDWWSVGPASAYWQDPVSAVAALPTCDTTHTNFIRYAVSENAIYRCSGSAWTAIASTGNAATATALAANPTDCAANQFANAIAASGNLTCAAIADADVPNTITIDLAAAATAMAEDVIAAGSAPTVDDTSSNSCGTTDATIVGRDSGGKVTVGATAGTSCTVTFADAWANAPACIGNNETTAAAVNVTSTTTTLVIAGTFTAADVLSYVCIGY